MVLGIDREKILSEIRAEPTGWGSIDIERLLEAWGFKSRDLGDSFGRTNRLWYHESDPKRFYVVVPLADPLARAIIEQAIDVVDGVSRSGGRL